MSEHNKIVSSWTKQHFCFCLKAASANFLLIFSLKNFVDLSPIVDISSPFSRPYSKPFHFSFFLLRLISCHLHTEECCLCHELLSLLLVSIQRALKVPAFHEGNGSFPSLFMILEKQLWMGLGKLFAWHSKMFRWRQSAFSHRFVDVWDHRVLMNWVESFASWKWVKCESISSKDQTNSPKVFEEVLTSSLSQQCSRSVLISLRALVKTTISLSWIISTMVSVL